jgi:iron complex transport system permease protein
MLADLVARATLAPTEIPVGVVTAFVGVPLFLVLLRRSLAAR